MATQENRKPGGLANNFWVQMVILAIVVVVVVVLAAKYLW
jgi:anti-sigma-K factor RskA